MKASHFVPTACGKQVGLDNEILSFHSYIYTMRQKGVGLNSESLSLHLYTMRQGVELDSEMVMSQWYDTNLLSIFRQLPKPKNKAFAWFCGSSKQ